MGHGPAADTEHGKPTHECARPHARPGPLTGPTTSHAPDPPTRKIHPGNHGSGSRVDLATTAVTGDQDGDSGFGLWVIQIVASTAAAVTAAVMGPARRRGHPDRGRARVDRVRCRRRGLRSLAAGDPAPHDEGAAAGPPRRRYAGRDHARRDGGRWPARIPPGTARTLRRPDGDSPRRRPGPAGAAPVRRPDHGARRHGRGHRGLRRQPGHGDAAGDRQGRPAVRGTGLSIHGANTPQPTTDPTTVTLTTSSTSRSSTPATTATVTQTLTRSPTPSPTPASSTAAPSSSARSSAASATRHPRVRGHCVRRRNGRAGGGHPRPHRPVNGPGLHMHAPIAGLRPTAATTQ